MKFIKPCVFNDDLSSDFRVALKIAKDLGLEYVKLRDVNGHSIGDTTKKEVEEMKSILKDSPVQIGAIGSPVIGKGCMLDDEKMYREQRIVWEKCLDLCNEFGVNTLRVFAFTKPKEIIENYYIDDYLDTIVSKLKDPVRQAEEAGVTVMFETEWKTYVGTAEEASKLMDALDSKYVKVCWDVMNAWYGGDTRSFPCGYRFIKGRIAHVHAKDIKLDLQMNSISGTRVPVGQGHIPWKRITELLVNDGYQGFITAERKFAPKSAATDPITMQTIKEDVKGLFDMIQAAQEK